jgi:hypothetical protein
LGEGEGGEAVARNWHMRKKPMRSERGLAPIETIFILVASLLMLLAVFALTFPWSSVGHVAPPMTAQPVSPTQPSPSSSPLTASIALVVSAIGVLAGLVAWSWKETIGSLQKGTTLRVLEVLSIGEARTRGELTSLIVDSLISLVDSKHVTTFRVSLY